MKSRHMRCTRWRTCDLAIFLGTLEASTGSNAMLKPLEINLEGVAMKRREENIRKVMLEA